jgi:putative SOS response-associated peptidase YedK
MAIAGLREAFVAAGQQIIRTYCIITTAANAVVAPIHDRMPLVLDEKDWPIWLGERLGDPKSRLRPLVHSGWSNPLTPTSVTLRISDEPHEFVQVRGVKLFRAQR